MRDFIKELDELSTAFRGYDKEETMLYIKDLLQYCEEEKKKELDKLIEQSNSLRQELGEAKNRETAMQSQYDALLARFEKLSDAMSENAKYMAERDAQLDEFHRKEKEIDTLLERAREDADREKKKMLLETEESCKKLIADAEGKKQEIMRKCDNYLLYVRNKAEEENRKVRADTAYLRQELNILAEKLTPILFEKTEESQTAPVRQTTGEKA